MLRAKEFNVSGWLSVLPLVKDQFDLSTQEFRDALALCYCKPLLSLPGTCDGCGTTFTIDHAFDCHFGGLVTHRHNKVHDAVGDLVSLVWNPVRCEPTVKEAGSDDCSALIADLTFCGVWQPQCEAIFDIRVVDTVHHHIALVLLRMFYILPRWTRSTSTLRPVKIAEQVLLQFAFLLMDCLGKRLISSFATYVNFYVLNGNDLLY